MSGQHGTVSIEEAPADDEHDPPLRRAAGLVWVLSRKNFQVRYKRATLGVIWAVAQPLFQTAILSFVFLVVFAGTAKKIDHYPIYVLCGMLPWAYFAQSLSAATTSVVDNAGLVRKVAVPSVIFPLAAIGGIAQAFMGSVVLMLLAAAYVHDAGWSILLMPVAFVLQTAFTVALGVLTSTFQVALRDVKYLVDAGLMAFFYATPVLYSIERVPEEYRGIFSANPMAGVLSLYRAAVLGRPVLWSAVAVTAVATVAVGLLATWAHRRRSDEFADLV